MLPFKVFQQLILVLIPACVFNHTATAQVDSTANLRNDTIPVVKTDTIASPMKKKDKKAGKKSTYIVYGGANFNTLNTESTAFESNSKTGWHLGASYRRGKFFYWQAGLRYNNARYELKPATDTAQTYSFSSLDVPLSAGVNFVPFLNRILNIRVFVSAMPAFRLNVEDNTLGITKSNTNSFNMYGQAGLGVDITFLVIEAGFNYGFSDQLKDHSSNPGQAFVSLGFRF